MIVDASAAVAIMVREPGAPGLAERLLGSRHRLTHPVSLYEAALAIARIKRESIGFGRREVEEFCDELSIGIVPIGPAEAAAALDALRRHGKGRHPAALNMGDCFSYACARTRGIPLLNKGEDFALTDVVAA